MQSPIRNGQYIPHFPQQRVCLMYQCLAGVVGVCFVSKALQTCFISVSVWGNKYVCGSWNLKSLWLSSEKLQQVRVKVGLVRGNCMVNFPPAPLVSPGECHFMWNILNPLSAILSELFIPNGHYKVAICLKICSAQLWCFRLRIRFSFYCMILRWK